MKKKTKSRNPSGAKGTRKARARKPAAHKTREVLAVSNTTRAVEVENIGTLSHYLIQHGLGRLKAGTKTKSLDASSVLRVEGGEKYAVGKVIAEGGMGIVREAHDLNCRRTVAMKVLRSKDPRYEHEDLLRFVQEAQITSQLEHPNIVPVHELGVDALGNVYYTMKYVKGAVLSEVLDDIRRGRQETIEQYPLARLLTLFQKVCDAIAFAHSRCVIHRDLKPDNVMIGDFGEVLVTDWGLSKILDASLISTSVSEMTALEYDGYGAKAPSPDQITPQPGKTTVSSIRTDTICASLKTLGGRVMGTLGYMAPEQARPGEPVDYRADIYALGGILYSILTLRPPIRGDNLKEVLLKIVRGDIVPPAMLNRWPDLPQEESSKFQFPHCPGGQIPVALSDIAMKAMALNPADRYPSVRALQRDVEAYQDGLIWHLIVDEDFSRSDFESRWEIVGGRHEWKSGELRLYGGEPQLLLLRRDVPGDVRIEFVCRQESAYLNDVGCLLSAIRSPNRKEIPGSGYELKYGGYSNTLNVLTKCNQRIWSCPDSPLVQGKTYRVVAERMGSRLRMEVNGEEIFRVSDPDPLSGSDRTTVGLLGWVADTRYTRVRVFTLGAPWKTDIIEVAERQLLKGHYTTAMDLYQDILQSAPEPDRAERAQKGYETARMRHEMQTRLPEWQERLRSVWPNAPVQLRLDKNGLTAELNHAGIRDLSPLQGLPLTTLYCAGNEITSLEPLRGMSLVTLQCSANPIRDLEPLRGMPLQTVLCEGARVRSLAPLRDSPLTMLNCGGCPLEDGIEPLRGMRLTWLACWGCGLDSLEPLKGMPLQALYCDANRIRSLEPLAGMPLGTLMCSGNQIESLQPLAGMPLVTLHCGGNRIESLEPLRGMSLTMLSCHVNRVRSLDPLVGMPLRSCTCGANPLPNIGSLIRTPPESFIFDSDAIPTEELEWIHRAWSRDFRFAAHARQVAVLLTLRRRSLNQLRTLASEFRGHHYLFVPRLLTWQEARIFCEEAGGHLVTLTSEEENDFVASLFPRGSWCWMGLYTRNGRHEWVTGEPFDFQCFADPLRERIDGPKIFASGAWSFDVWPEARNGFVLEWDS